MYRNFALVTLFYSLGWPYAGSSSSTWIIRYKLQSRWSHRWSDLTLFLWAYCSLKWRNWRSSHASQCLRRLLTSCHATLGAIKTTPRLSAGNLQEIVAADANIDIVDEQGYAPLTYALFNDHAKIQDILLNALRFTVEGGVDSQLMQRQKRAKI